MDAEEIAQAAEATARTIRESVAEAQTTHPDRMAAAMGESQALSWETFALQIRGTATRRRRERAEMHERARLHLLPPPPPPIPGREQ